MNEPVTTLDPRYSDPNAVPTDWEQTRGVLEAAEVFWLATVRTDGRPHVTPVVGVWADGALHFSTADTEQKASNLQGNAHVILTTGCNRWQEGLDIVVEGEAVRVTGREQLERLAQVWATRWDGRWRYLVRDDCFYHHDDHEVLPDRILVFAVTPAKIFAFAKGDPFSHTRHQF
jgi:nitroimidazol reductase NimA-like FMN-containing flavoprotein (pyridoxamine 5'-phosphate oxidase superfamily)